MQGYQLVIKGSFVYFGGSRTIHSKKVFLSQEKAEEHQEEFVRLCTTTAYKEDLSFLDKDQKYAVNIIEVEIVE
jgi:hypothetical protein